MDIMKYLKDNSTIEYKNFVIRSAPGIDKDKVLGVRIPTIRVLVKMLTKEEKYAFLNSCHTYQEELLLYRFIIENLKDYDEMIYYLNKYIPNISNWILCDGFRNNSIKKNKDKLIKEIKKWLNGALYYKRFAIDVMMSYYLDDDFKIEYLDYVNIESDEYYLNMMEGFFYATALAKQYDDAIKYLENNKLTVTVHNITIRKANESFRIDKDIKEYLKTLKR